MSLLWINGQLIDKAEARVSPFDHGFLYGDGVWEPFRVFRGRLFRPHEHLALLWDAAATIEIDIPLSQAELLAAIEATVQANNRTEGYVRVIATRGPGTIGPDPRKLDPQVFITAEEYLPFPHELYDHGLHAVIHPYPIAPGNPAYRVRTIGQVHVVLAKARAINRGSLEAVFITPGGELAAGTEGNLFMVRGGTITVAPGVPVDVARGVVIELACEAGIPNIVETFRPADILKADLFAADELFLAGTSCGIIGIVHLNGQSVGPGMEGPITRQIREAYRRLTRGE